ncbi:MAG: hypothetical protein COA73_13650 [Candidatus Hydrogenedentota bacterium]|nr:MAG: hypothetical protein COA73_13650 [Candidatus Hydrogenedentota bacterium]
MLAQEYKPISKAQVNPGIMDVSGEQTSILRQVDEGNLGLQLPMHMIPPFPNHHSAGLPIEISSRSSVNVNPFNEIKNYQFNHVSTHIFEKALQPGINLKQQAPRKESHKILREVFIECMHANWDGEGADPVDDSTFTHANKFLDLLPIETPLPEIDASPHGLITFEWDLSSRRTLVAGIDSKGYIYYSALFDDEDERGKVRMDQKACFDIASLAQRIFSN